MATFHHFCSAKLQRIVSAIVRGSTKTEERQQWGSGHITFVYKALSIQGQDPTSSILAWALWETPLKKGVDIDKGAVRLYKSCSLKRWKYIYSPPLSCCCNPYSHTFTISQGNLAVGYLTFPPYSKRRLSSGWSLSCFFLICGSESLHFSEHRMVVCHAGHSPASLSVA